MAYDVELADLVRAVLSAEPEVSEKRMFGGLAFLVAGHMAVAVSGQDGLLLRIDRDQRDSLTADPRATPFVMRGRPLAGWLHVAVDGSVNQDDLRRWVDLGVAEARSQPPR